MRLGLVELLGDGILTASSIDHLREALTRATRDMGFDRFALSLEIGCAADSSTSLLVHDYPASWADVYIGFNLAATDPVRLGSAQPSARHQARRSIRDRRPYRTRATAKDRPTAAQRWICARPALPAFARCCARWLPCLRHHFRLVRPSVTACRCRRRAIAARPQRTGSHHMTAAHMQALRRPSAPSVTSC